MNEVDNSPPGDRAAYVAEFLERFGLKDFPPEALDLSMAHRSYSYEEGLEADNERLEFLGDSVISTVTSEYLYQLKPGADEGDLSKLRSRLVSRGVLGRCARDLGLGHLILLGRGERSTGGAKRRSVLGSALEALVGAIYLSLGYEISRKFVREAILENLIQETAAVVWECDYKSLLQEWTQKKLHCVPRYRRLGSDGPDHEKVFHVQAEIDGKNIAKGSGPRIKSAENDAAREAWRMIESGEFQPG